MKILITLFCLMLSFNASADVVKEVESFLKEVANGEAFWLHQPKEYYTPGNEEDYFQFYNVANKGKSFCSSVEENRKNTFSISQKVGLSDKYAVVFRGKSSSERDLLLLNVLNIYGLKEVILSEEVYEKVASRLSSIEKEFFLVNPKKRQIINFKTAHPCLLENDLSIVITGLLKSEYSR